jgi:ketopantoate reductase
MTGALGEGPEYSTNFQRQSRMQPSGWNILGLGAVGSLVAAQAVSRGYSIPAIVRHKHAHVTFNGASLELEQHLCANAPKISRLILATKAPSKECAGICQR